MRESSPSYGLESDKQDRLDHKTCHLNYFFFACFLRKNSTVAMVVFIFFSLFKQKIMQFTHVPSHFLIKWVLIKEARRKLILAKVPTVV